MIKIAKEIVTSLYEARATTHGDAELVHGGGVADVMAGNFSRFQARLPPE